MCKKIHKNLVVSKNSYIFAENLHNEHLKLLNY